MIANVTVSLFHEFIIYILIIIYIFYYKSMACMLNSLANARCYHMCMYVNLVIPADITVRLWRGHFFLPVLCKTRQHEASTPTNHAMLSCREGS